MTVHRIQKSWEDSKGLDEADIWPYDSSEDFENGLTQIVNAFEITDDILHSLFRRAKMHEEYLHLREESETLTVAGPGSDILEHSQIQPRTEPTFNSKRSQRDEPQTLQSLYPTSFSISPFRSSPSPHSGEVAPGRLSQVGAFRFYYELPTSC